MATKFLDKTGLSHFWSKIKAWCNAVFAPIAHTHTSYGVKHSYTVAVNAAKNWYRIANANTSQLDTTKPIRAQFIVTAYNTSYDANYYETWFVNTIVFGKQAHIIIFGNSNAPFSQARILYENTTVNIDANDRPAIDLYLNYVLPNGTTKIEVEEIYNNGGWTFVSDGQLAASSVPSGFESIVSVPRNNGVSNSTYADYVPYLNRQISDFTTTFTLADSYLYRSRTLNCTGTFTITIPSINSGYMWCVIKNKNTSSGVITLHPSTTSVLIDGSNADITLQPREYVCIHSAGANNYSLIADGRWKSQKADKATTLAGYGITDAKIANGTIILGSNSITPLISHQTLPTLSRTISGSGNAITDITVSNHAITATKGAMFLTSHQTLPTLSLTTSGNGNAITALFVSNHAITVTKGTTFLTSHQSLDGKMTRGSYERIEGTSSAHKDLNNYTTAGFYNVKTANVDNCPSDIGIDAVLLVYPWNSGTYCTQELTESAASSDVRRWVRKYNQSTWTDWKQLAFQSSISDTLMTQNKSTTNATYPILLCPTADANANQGAKTGIFCAGVKINASTGYVYTTGNFIANNDTPNLVSKYTTLVRNTAPSSTHYTKGLDFVDSNNVSFCGVEHRYDTDKDNRLQFIVYKGTDTNVGETGVMLGCGYNSSGNAYTYTNHTPAVTDNSSQLATTYWVRRATGNFACNAATATKIETTPASNNSFVYGAKTGGALVNATTTNYGAIWNAPTKNYRVACSTHPGNNDNVYICYSITNADINSNTNTIAKSLKWNADTGILTADTFSGSLSGNATTVTGTAGTSTLAWNSEVTLYTVGGHAIKAKLPANPNSDTLVTQNVSTTDSTYPLLLCPTANATANQGAKTAIFPKSVKVNASTNELYATKLHAADTKVLSNNGLYENNDDTLFICGGLSISTSSHIKINGYQASSFSFMLRALSPTSTSTYADLALNYDGTLKWKGQTVQTSSDERLKTPISSVDDNVLDAWADVSWGQFKFLDAIKEKGDNARFHVGLIAQSVDRTCIAKDVDIRRYGILCHDEWEDEYVEEDGKQVLYNKAGDIWMVRYTEALCMEAAYQRRKNKILENRISELEERLAKLEGAI